MTTDKKSVVDTYLKAKGPVQIETDNLVAHLGSEYGARFMIPMNNLGHDVLDTVRALNGQGFTIETKTLTGGPMPEKVGLDPRLVLEQHLGDEPVMIDPTHARPL